MSIYLKKVQNKRKCEEEAKAGKEASGTARKNKKSINEVAEPEGPSTAAQNKEVSTRFVEDDNFVDMGISSDLRKEFPSQSEEENESTDSELEEEDTNNNANMLERSPSANQA